MNHQSQDDIISQFRELHSTALSLLELILQLSLVSMNTQYQSHVCSRCHARETLFRTTPDVGSSSALPGANHPSTTTAGQQFPTMATPNVNAGSEPQRDTSIPSSLPRHLVPEFTSLPDHLQGLIRLQHAVMAQTRATSHHPNSNFQPIGEVGDHVENIHQVGTVQNEGSRAFSFKNFLFKRRTAR